MMFRERKAISCSRAWRATFLLVACYGALGDNAKSAVREADVALLQAVAPRFFAQTTSDAAAVEGFAEAFALAKPGRRWAWPPRVGISDDTDSNAFATIVIQPWGSTPTLADHPRITWIALADHVPQIDPDGPPDPPEIEAVLANLPTIDRSANANLDPNSTSLATGDSAPALQVIQPIIVFKQGYLDQMVRGEEGPLAGTLGHELSHILLGHVLGRSDTAPLVGFAITRTQEADADNLGTTLALRAQFDYQAIVAGARREREAGYRCSMQGMRSTHPGWNDRLALIDSRQRERWHSIDAFENGVYFLMAEQYALAQRCFGEVTKKYPQCYEAWANKGYAELMMFCDGLEPDDLRQMDIGHLVVGGFYARPESLTPRGVDEEMWFDAVGDLRQALLLKPDLVMAKANLAVAWLLRPAGKDTGKAEQLFQEVSSALINSQFDEPIDPVVHAALLTNAGVAEVAQGDAATAEIFFGKAAEIAGNQPDSAQHVINAVRYNRARILASQDNAASRSAAIEHFEGYLTDSSPTSTWWQLAWDDYQRICRDAGHAPKPQATLASPQKTIFRQVAGIELANGQTVTLNDTVQSMQEVLGKGQQVTVVPRTKIFRWRYAELGLDLLCTDRVIAIRLQGEHAPALQLKSSGPNQARHTIRPGMTLEAVNEGLAGDANQWDLRYGTNSSIVYRFYPRLGFGIRLTDAQRVTEVIVAQIPRAASLP